MSGVRVLSDSTCDLGDAQLKKYGITLVPLCIILEEQSFLDREEITPEEIFEWSEKHKTTPKTAAITMERALQAVREAKEAGEDMIFFGISEDMSTTCNVMRMAAQEEEYDRVFVINSENLSTGIGLQVIRAAELAAQGLPAEKIVKQIEAARPLVRASFIVDTLTYLSRGGRCSAATALLANTLKLKPRIVVENGKMGVDKKYRGSLSKVLMKYTEDMEQDLLRADPARVFITHSGCSREIVEAVRTYLEGLGHFNEVIETRAGGVVSSHCGPGTLGVLFYLEG